MKKALLLLNMGGPNSIDEIELFLRAMFSDKNILPVNPVFRKLIANIIVSKRLEQVKKNFLLLDGKSPLSDLTYQLIVKLSKNIDIPVFPAMRYVPPLAMDALIKCQKSGIDELILFPMYPHFSTTTTLSSAEDIEAGCKELGYSPKITLITHYYDDYAYIKASCEQIIEAVKGVDTIEYDLLLSAHGLPKSIIKAGDPYEKHIMANVSAIKTYLSGQNIYFNEVKLVYQSKVGSSAWLEPSLTDTLRNPTNRKVVIYPLAFTVDNSETLFELDIENREIAKKIRYKDYVVVPCMNDCDAFVRFIVDKINAV